MRVWDYNHNACVYFECVYVKQLNSESHQEEMVRRSRRGRTGEFLYAWLKMNALTQRVLLFGICLGSTLAGAQTVHVIMKPDTTVPKHEKKPEA